MNFSRMRVTFDRGVHSDLIQRFSSCLIVGAVKSTTYIKLYASVSIGGRGGGGGDEQASASRLSRGCPTLPFPSGM